MPEQYVITPGGYRPISMVHHVEPGHVLDVSEYQLRKLDLAGKVVAEYGAMPVKAGAGPLMPLNLNAIRPETYEVRPSVGGTAAAPARVPGLASGWITYAYWNNGTGRPITSFRTVWRVPPFPLTQNGQLIYIFNGIQNASMIYQPVLQWGNNGAFGGNYWGVASWYADGQGGPAFYSAYTPVAVDQILTGIMTETGRSGNNFNYDCVFQGIANSSLPVQNIPELTWCAETLECYNMTTCSDYPAAGRTEMSGIEIVTTGGHPALNWTGVNAHTDCGQHTIVVSNNSPGGEVDLYYNYATDYIVDKSIIFHDTSPLTPAIASLNGRIYMAWKGDGNDNLNVMYSTDNGVTFGHKYTSPETSPQAPALCAHNGSLYIGWKGDGNDNLNVAQVALSGNNITGFINKRTLGDTSPKSPSLASLGGRLYLAWKGDGNDNLNVMYSADNGSTFGHKYTSPETSPQAPGLCAAGTSLLITWKGDGNDNLNVAQVVISGNNITGFANKVILGDTSPVSPALAYDGNKVYLSWKGDGNNFLNVMYSSNGGRSFGNKAISSERSPQPPSLCVQSGVVYISWKGDGNDYLNLAQVGLG
ncbi:MAG TPA: hypothetical protein VFB04_16455 [Terriglobales bacterium]|nr:hypothetical protein [Terriglobales bacterium]